MDSAFSRELYLFLIKSSQDYRSAAGDAPEMVPVMRQATLARKRSEWGMRSFKCIFLRLKDRIIYEENGEGKLILLTKVLLFNLRSKLVGVNQILNTYMPNLGIDANDFLGSTVKT